MMPVHLDTERDVVLIVEFYLIGFVRQTFPFLAVAAVAGVS